MDKKVVITIGREFGSGGREIGEKLAEKLKIAYYDRNILDLVAQKSGIDKKYLETEDEKASNPFDEPYVPHWLDTGTLSERLFRMQSKLIREKAEEESCVVVGRCSDVLLRERTDAFHIFVFAPFEYRVNRAMELFQIEDREKAEKVVKKADKARKTYYQYYTDEKWGSRNGKDLLINSSTCGIDGSVEMIIKLLEEKGYRNS
ncbi:MAG: cytidylate kinase-like family protein [Lachnospiraceae bacterium]|nr:cytidylate kinase-like family protein [Lachnospiraceae bacterium]